MSIRAHLPLLAFAIFSASAACSSDPAATTPVADAEVADTGTADTKKPVDAAETGTISGCEVDLPSGFACGEPVKATGGATSCSEAMLADFVEQCLAADFSEPATCATWKAANAGCATCIADWSWDSADLPPKIYPDDYKCYWANMDAPCAKASNCSFDCEYAACGECGSLEEYNDCVDSVSSAGGKCWSVASETAKGCFDKYPVRTTCNVDELYSSSPDITKLRAEVLRFYRGACRDNGNWTNASSPGDAGTTETGGSDTGTADTSVTDTGAAADAAEAG